MQLQESTMDDHAAAATRWHEFGLYVCPLAPESKQTVIPWDQWIDTYSPGYIEAYWNTHPEHLVGAILTNETIVFDADDPAAITALEALEKAHGITVTQVHRTRKGVHHFFRREAHTSAKCVSCSTAGHPAGIDIRTARLEGLGTGVGAGIIVLPPSGGRTVVTGADCLANLPEVGQDFIDAVMAHNDATKPRRKVAVSLPDNVVPGPQGTQPEVDYLLSHIDPDCSYEDWVAVGMGLKDKLGHVGLDTWDRWSSRGEKYAGPGELERKWSTFTGTGTTFATVAHLARDNGADLLKFSKGDMGLIIAGDAVEQAKASLSHSPQFVDLRLLKSGGAQILATMDNLRVLMHYYGIDARYNVIHKRVYVSGIQCLAGEEENSLYAELLSKSALHGYPERSLGHYLERIGQLNAFNPVTDYLETLDTLGGDPIPAFVAHCSFTEPEWALIACRRWFIQAVAAADYAQRSGNALARPEFPYVLTIAGAQGLVKTSLGYDLLPRPIKDCFTAGRMLDTSRRDSIYEAVQNWIVELGEIDSTFRKSDIAALKAFLTKQVDDMRMPYARGWSRMPRRTCYFATVNQLKFLQDATGNRRFWPLEIVAKIPPLAENLAEAIWAWAWGEYLAGEQWWLTSEEERIHARVVRQYEEKPLGERLLDCYDFNSDSRAVLLTSTEILREICWPQTDRSAATTLGLQLKELKIARDDKTRSYKLPPRTSANVHNL